jgi:hypothetical protein
MAPIENEFIVLSYLFPPKKWQVVVVQMRYIYYVIHPVALSYAGQSSCTSNAGSTITVSLDWILKGASLFSLKKIRARSAFATASSFEKALTPKRGESIETAKKQPGSICATWICARFAMVRPPARVLHNRIDGKRIVAFRECAKNIRYLGYRVFERTNQGPSIRTSKNGGEKAEEAALGSKLT